MLGQTCHATQCISRAKGACLVKIRCHFALFVSVLQHFHRYQYGKNPPACDRRARLIPDHDTVTCEPPAFELQPAANEQQTDQAHGVISGGCCFSSFGSASSLSQSSTSASSGG